MAHSEFFHLIEAITYGHSSALCFVALVLLWFTNLNHYKFWNKNLQVKKKHLIIYIGGSNNWTAMIQGR